MVLVSHPKLCDARSRKVRVQNVIIITSGKSDLAGQGLLDKYIDLALSWNKRAIVVLGPEGDDFLFEARKIEACDLAFDQEFKGHEFSSVKAAVECTAAPSVILHLDSKLPDLDFLKELDQALASEEALTSHVMRVVDFADRPRVEMITPRGVAHLKTLPVDTDWLESACVTCSLYQANSPMLDQQL
jgi:hypothetical protein